MQKLIKITSIFFIFIFLFFNSSLNKPVQAQCSSCTSYQWVTYSCPNSACGSKCYDSSGNLIGGFCTVYQCVTGQNCGGVCGPGYYQCNNSSGCCPIGPVPSGGGTGSGCTETAPSGLTSTRLSATSAKLDWTPGTGGGYQYLWVSTNADPQTGCAGSTGGTPDCPVRLDSGTTPLDSAINTYTVSNLSANTAYYWEIMNVQSATCWKQVTNQFISSCSISTNSVTLPQGRTQVISSNIGSSNGIQRLEFISGSPSVFTATTPDTAYPYQTTVTGVSPGAGTLSANVYFSAAGPIECTANASVTVTPPVAWWQVKDADLASFGDLDSELPPGILFDLSGAGGFPGVPSYGGTSLFLNNSDVSTKGWIVQSPIYTQKIYDYAYFNNQIPADTVIANLTSNILDQTTVNSNTNNSYGYLWYKYDGSGNGLDLNLNTPLNIGSKKVILLVNSADFYINAPINLTKGQGFFMVIVGKDANGNKGSIHISPTVGGGSTPNLEGIYVADNNFISSSNGTIDIQLRVRGSVAAYNGLNLLRNLGSTGNLTTPAEYFEYAPDQIMLFPSKLGLRKLNWKEVAP